jgi:GTP-binding protein Era
MTKSIDSRTGYVSLIGKTNVGKSTLLNQIVEQKVSITSRKPQTTRHRLLGIKTKAGAQAVFIDTPGFHQGQKRALNRYMNKVALDAMSGVDVLLYVIEALRFDEEDERLLAQIPANLDHVILVINKVDRVLDKGRLLPFIEKLSRNFNFSDIVPISALKDQNIDSLEASIFSKLPKGAHSYPEDQVADTTERFLTSEIIREKCITRVGDEIPYRISVMIDSFKLKNEVTHIDATLFVEKKSQKGIVIGQGGKRLKSIGMAARLDLEEVLQTKVMLNLWVKVKNGWTDNEAFMSTMGYDLG